MNSRKQEGSAQKNLVPPGSQIITPASCVHFLQFLGANLAPTTEGDLTRCSNLHFYALNKNISLPLNSYKFNIGTALNFVGFLDEVIETLWNDIYFFN
jgi:hypothetical protein